MNLPKNIQKFRGSSSPILFCSVVQSLLEFFLQLTLAKNIFKNDEPELSISQAKHELEGIISYYDGVSSVLLNKIIQTRQDTNIWDSNNTIVKCMESIYSSLSNFINVLGQQVSDHEYSEMLDKLSDKLTV